MEADHIPVRADPPEEPGSTRRARLRSAAVARGIPLPAILVTVAVVALTYLAGELIYRLRDVILLIVMAGFIALILNPFVVFVQRRIARRGPAVAKPPRAAVLRAPQQAACARPGGDRRRDPRRDPTARPRRSVNKLNSHVA
jgi:hypothetical protein